MDSYFHESAPNYHGDSPQTPSNHGDTPSGANDWNFPPQLIPIENLSLSNNSLSQDESESLTISVSTAFNPRSHDEEPNLIFCSSDGVVFYVNYDVIVKASSTAFQERINDPSLASVEIPADSMKIVPISEPSSVLNLMLHALYGTPSAQHSPTFETLVAAVNNMPLYGIDPKAHISRSSHLYGTLVAYAPLYPLELYTLAAHFDLYDLAVATSSHLLSCQLSTITDEMAERMGPLYLKRLFNLHNNLFDTLKQILLSPPLPHGPTKICSFEDQRRLTRAWALASAHLAWDTRPDLSTESIKRAFTPLLDQLSCDQCHEGLTAKINNVVNRWATAKRTI